MRRSWIAAWVREGCRWRGEGGGLRNPSVKLCRWEALLVLELEGDLCGDGEAFASGNLEGISESVLKDILNPAVVASLSVTY